MAQSKIPSLSEIEAFGHGEFNELLEGEIQETLDTEKELAQLVRLRDQAKAKVVKVQQLRGG